MNFDALFTVIRRIGGGSLTQAEVDEVNAVLRTSGGVTAPSKPEQKREPRRVSIAGRDLIKTFEGLARVRSDGLVEAYPDPGTGGEPWTIGWGATGRDVRRGTVWTREQCEKRLIDDIERHAADVRAALGDSLAATSQAQFDALASFHYNTGAIHRATLTRKHKAGDFAAAAREFARWNRAGGRVLRGLVRRRAAEERLYRSGM